MKMPHITFQYDREKDINNLEIGLEMTRQGRKPEKILVEIINQFGDSPSRDSLESFLKFKWENKREVFDVAIKQMQSYWDAIERKYFDNIFSNMQLSNFFEVENISGFFSSRYGCGYNFNELWFAVSLFNGTLLNTRVTMHETMHIFFHKKWWDFCRQQGLPNKNIWDIKEATSVLLNIWFKDELLDMDMGYEEHVELRSLIKEKFLETNNFEKTLVFACDYMKKFPKKSPSWIVD